MQRPALAAVTAAATAMASLALAAGAVPAGGGAQLSVAGAAVHVDFDRSDFSGGDAILAWVRRSAQIVAAYYGRFPTPAVTLAP